MDSKIETVRNSPWHEGEIAIQQRAGVAEQMATLGRRTIRDHLIEQHRAFYPQLPFLVAGAVDPAGDAWATILCGRPGFLEVPDPLTLRVSAARNSADPADAGLDDGDAAGLLGIELHTRRRNRLNGTIRRRSGGGFEVAVAESFGNCPQYIRLRHFFFERAPSEPDKETPRSSTRLDAPAAAMIAKAETFFIASYVDRDGGRRQVDVSHRGGRPGFVHVGEDGRLTIPDFAGNRYFNTLGNILANPRCGLVFVDFEKGDLLQLTGDGEVILEGPEIAAFQGAERLLRFTPRRAVFRPGALALRWRSTPDGASPNALLTGSWDEAAARLRATALSRDSRTGTRFPPVNLCKTIEMTQQFSGPSVGWSRKFCSASAWRPFRVAAVAEESSVVRSLYLEPADGGGFVPHRAGQHLPIRVTLPGGRQAGRSYTLSSVPSDGVYRISVKRQGAVSQFLHGLKVGDTIEASAPDGAFTIDAHAERPAVLLAAGIGITPMLAMLRHLVYEGLRTRRIRLVWLFHAARTKAERAFDAEIAALRELGQGAVQVVRVLSDPAGAGEGDCEAHGRIDMHLLAAKLPFDHYDFYLCGPAPFMQNLHDGLRAMDVPDARIHAEAFGPSALRREGDPAEVAGETAKEPVDVVFAASGRSARWQPEAGSLLEFAEAQGLSPPFGCRGGTCGTCRTSVLGGAVAYGHRPSAEIGASEALICCARPAVGHGSLTLDL